MDFDQQMNVVYAERDGVGLILDLFTPVGASNGRGVVNVVSGAFFSGRENIRDLTDMGMYGALCRHGYTVFAVRPGSTGRWTVPEMREHCRLGLRWAKARAAEFGIDPDRMGITGVSAGGYLTCLTALSPVEGDPDADDPLERLDTRVAAVGAICPPVNLVSFLSSPKGRKQVVEWVYGRADVGVADDVLERLAQEYSPLMLAGSAVPPFVFFHADGDDVVPVAESEKMHAALQQAGADSTLHIIKSDEHVWTGIPADMERLADWFDEKLK